MAKVELKQPIVQEISETIKDAQSLVVVDYRGLTVAEDTQLRKNLREAGVTYKVYKNTLVNRAIEGTEFESLKDVLEGPNAFAVSTEDATAPARVLAEFAKKAPSLEIKAGVVEGTYYDAEGMKAHMMKHAAIMRPKFEAVFHVLESELNGLGIGSWTEPKGGYFISFDALEGCAKKIVEKCKEAGVVLTGAGATYPYKKDPKDSNIRLAPSFPTPEELAMATDLFVLCVKIVSVEKLLKEA